VCSSSRGPRLTTRALRVSIPLIYSGHAILGYLCSMNKLALWWWCSLHDTLNADSSYQWF
jgi:hypothetical protein